MTKKEMFNTIATINADNAEIVEFCKKEIELLEKRKSSPSKKKTAEAEARMDAVYEALSACETPVTVTELIAGATNEVAEYSNQRVSALLRKFVLDGRIEKTIEGKKAKFRVTA